MLLSITVLKMVWTSYFLLKHFKVVTPMSDQTEANHFTCWVILSFRWGRRPAGWAFWVLVMAETDRVLNNDVRRLCCRRRCSVEMNCEIWWTDHSNELILDIQWDSNELMFPWQQTGRAATRGAWHSLFVCCFFSTVALCDHVWLKPRAPPRGQMRAKHPDWVDAAAPLSYKTSTILQSHYHNHNNYIIITG